MTPTPQPSSPSRLLRNALKLFLVNLFKNKPDRATMRPGRVCACIDHVTYMGRQMDKQTGLSSKGGSRNKLVDHLLGSQRGQKQSRNAVFALAQRTQGRMD